MTNNLFTDEQRAEIKELVSEALTDFFKGYGLAGKNIIVTGTGGNYSNSTLLGVVINEAVATAPTKVPDIINFSWHPPIISKYRV